MEWVKLLGGSSRPLRRDLWSYWLNNQEMLGGITGEEEIKEILGREMFLRGHNGFSAYNHEDEIK